MARTLFRTQLLPIVLGAALSATACSEEAVSTPTAPTPTTIAEPAMTGTLTRNGAQTFAFVANTGSITATLTTVTPEDAVVGIALGEWNAATELCQLRLVNDAATKGKALIGAAQVTQNYCVRISDATGQLAAPVAFEINVSHF